MVTFVHEFWLETAYLLFYNLHDAWSLIILKLLLVVRWKVHALKSKCFRIHAIINYFTIHSFHKIMTHFNIQVFKTITYVLKGTQKSCGRVLVLVLAHLRMWLSLTCAGALVVGFCCYCFWCSSRYDERKGDRLEDGHGQIEGRFWWMTVRDKILHVGGRIGNRMKETKWSQKAE